jgi:cell division septation protein DedD
VNILKHINRQRQDTATTTSSSSWIVDSGDDDANKNNSCALSEEDEEEEEDLVDLEGQENHFSESTHHFLVPPPGITWRQFQNDEEVKEDRESAAARAVSSHCSICLCDMEVGDQITWSANISCNHVYHYDCIYNWFVMSGTKQLKQMYRRRERTLAAAQAVAPPEAVLPAETTSIPSTEQPPAASDSAIQNNESATPSTSRSSSNISDDAPATETTTTPAREPMLFHSDPIVRITKLPMECPCCRQLYLLDHQTKPDKQP